MSGIHSMTATRANTRANGGREANDFYRTPGSATRALLAVEQFAGPIWECACGDGAITRELEVAGHEVVSTDLVDRGFGTPRQDFLMEQRLLAPTVITNPPFVLADEFVLHALHLGAVKVAMFMRLAWLEGGARHGRLWSKHPPARVWVFSKRQTLWRGDDPDARDRGGTTAYAWFVWAKGEHDARLGWL